MDMCLKPLKVGVDCLLNQLQHWLLCADCIIKRLEILHLFLKGHEDSFVHFPSLMASPVPSLLGSIEIGAGGGVQDDIDGARDVFDGLGGDRQTSTTLLQNHICLVPLVGIGVRDLLVSPSRVRGTLIHIAGLSII